MLSYAICYMLFEHEFWDYSLLPFNAYADVSCGVRGLKFSEDAVFELALEILLLIASASGNVSCESCHLEPLLLTCIKYGSRQ